MIKQLVLTTLLTVPLIANSAVFNSWATNEGISGNYILNVDEQTTDGTFDFNLTVNPWNAEALGLFIDFGNYTVGSTSLSSITPSGQISLFATDTSSSNCGNGCNLNGLNPGLLTPDDQWELVFSLGSQGFNSIQTFSFTIDGLIGLDVSDIGLIGIRAQNLCDAGDTLPNGSCDGSDKSMFTDPGTGGDNGTVPEPTSLLLIGTGLLGLFGATRKKA